MTLEIEPKQELELQQSGSGVAYFNFFDLPPILIREENGLMPHWAVSSFIAATEVGIGINSTDYFPCSKRPFKENELIEVIKWEIVTSVNISLQQAMQPIPEDVEFIEVEKKRVREKSSVHWIPIFNTGISIPLLRIFSIKWKFVGYKQA